MEKSVNKCICCNVCDCEHNKRGCDCELEEVSISRGDGSHHFCKSYKCRDIKKA